MSDEKRPWVRFRGEVIVAGGARPLITCVQLLIQVDGEKAARLIPYGAPYDGGPGVALAALVRVEGETVLRVVPIDERAVPVEDKR